MNQVKRLAKIILITSAIIFVADLLVVIGFSVIHPTAPRIDAVIVLGAKVGTPALTQRALQGLKYYQEGKTETLVLSGSRGSSEPVSEARAMQEVVVRQVAKTSGKMPRIILEDKSINTYQNIHNSKTLIPAAKSVLIVSDGFHLARSVAIAKRDGFQKVYWDAPTPSYYPPWDLAYYYLHEVVGIITYIPRFITN